MKESDSFAREERIRAKAYQIWLDEGCPDGRDEAHWGCARARCHRGQSRIWKNAHPRRRSGWRMG